MTVQNATNTNLDLFTQKQESQDGKNMLMSSCDRRFLTHEASNYPRPHSHSLTWRPPLAPEAQTISGGSYRQRRSHDTWIWSLHLTVADVFTLIFSKWLSLSCGRPFSNTPGSLLPHFWAILWETLISLGQNHEKGTGFSPTSRREPPCSETSFQALLSWLFLSLSVTFQSSGPQVQDTMRPTCKMNNASLPFCQIN